MENPILPTPPSGSPYIVEFLVGLLSVCLVVAGYLYREHSKYRDKREADDRAFRDEQTRRQAEQWAKESEARDKFRIGFEQRSDERFDGLEHDAKAFHAEIRGIMETQQKQIASLQSQLDRLGWESNHKNSPKEGGK